MPHKSRPRHLRNAKRTRSHNPDTTRNERSYNVVFVWGSDDMTTRRLAVYDRHKAMACAKSLAARGAKIVLVKKGTFNTGMKLIADFSTVGGA